MLLDAAWLSIVSSSHHDEHRPEWFILYAAITGLTLKSFLQHLLESGDEGGWRSSGSIILVGFLTSFFPLPFSSFQERSFSSDPAHINQLKRTKTKKPGKHQRLPNAMEDVEEDGQISPTSSPPTPPSPLPISTGPGNQKYYFSPSPTLTPPFSPPQSSHTSAENLPLLQEASGPSRTPPLAFSLDLKRADEAEDSRSSCLKDLLEWFVRRCCNCYIES